MKPMDVTSLDSIYSLPIASRKDEILHSVDNNQVTIITAETGAGKSTQVPQFLAEHGYRKIIITQPRILAARNLCLRVRQEYSWRRGNDATNLVGYRTAHEQDDHPDNAILYCTDGLQLVRELAGNGTNDKQVLVLDEIHEWNENMEVLIAWAKRRCQEEPRFKIVLMSATIEAESLAEYFSAPPPITVEGRSFPVENRYSKDLLAEIDAFVLQRKNILVFLPGKAEIEMVTEALEYSGTNVPIIPLHSQLEPESQQLAFGNYPNGKVILSTNIAQTSITIDDIDVVIDSGLERRTEVRGGVEGLFISEVSQADCLQRAGRTGRTREGIYILAKYDRMPCSLFDERTTYGIPEIMRKHIDRLVLRLANIGLDIESLEFFHSPSRSTIKQAKRTLTILGALQNGNVTTTGHQMERFPVESTYARMLVEVEQYPETVRAKLAAIIAIQEVGGIVKGGPRFSGWRRYTRQNRSDLLAQYDVWLAMPTIPEEEYEELGIIAKNIDKARETYERLSRDLGVADEPLDEIKSEEVEPILKSIVAGQIHEIWALESNGEAVHLASKKRREVSSSTVVKHSGLFVGTPFDLEIATPKGLEVLRLVNDLTAVDPAWLDELAPDMFRIRTGKIYFDNFLGTLASTMQIQFRGRNIETAGSPILHRTDEHQKLFARLYAQSIYQQLEKDRQALPGHKHRSIPPIPLKRIEEKVRYFTAEAISVAELPKNSRVSLLKLSKLSSWHPKDSLDDGAPVRSRHGGSHRFISRKNNKHHAKTKDRWRNRDHD